MGTPGRASLPTREGKRGAGTASLLKTVMKVRVWIGWIAFVLWAGWAPAALGLSADELLLLNQARAIASAPLEDFSELGGTNGVRDGHYRYQLAFLGYGLCSIAAVEPELRPEARKLFTRLVEKMEQPAALAYWRRLGYPGEGLARDNAMYRGHLNLMYGLARDRFGEQRFDARFHALSRELFEEISGPHPVCCEPDQVFVQCNSVIVLSLWFHDRGFGTSYAAAGQSLLDWARQHMGLAGTSLVREDYHPSTGHSQAGRAGYANAWAIAFLAPVPGLGEEARKMYGDWRRIFAEPPHWGGGEGGVPRGRLRPDELLCAGVPVMTFGWLAWVRGAPAGERLSDMESLASGLLATTFGVIAAQAAGDEALHARLVWTVGCIDTMVASFEQELPAERRVQAQTWRTIALFARTFRGWNAVLGGPAWGPKPD